MRDLMQRRTSESSTSDGHGGNWADGKRNFPVSAPLI